MAASRTGCIGSTEWDETRHCRAGRLPRAIAARSACRTAVGQGSLELRGLDCEIYQWSGDLAKLPLLAGEPYMVKAFLRSPPCTHEGVSCLLCSTGQIDHPRVGGRLELEAHKFPAHSRPLHKPPLSANL